MILLISDSSMHLSAQQTNENSLKCIRKNILNIPTHLPPSHFREGKNGKAGWVFCSQPLSFSIKTCSLEADIRKLFSVVFYIQAVMNILKEISEATYAVDFQMKQIC